MQYTVLHAMSNLLATNGDQPPPQTIIAFKLHALEDQNHLQLQIFQHLSIPSWAWWGVPPHWRHPQVPSFTQKLVCQSMTFFPNLFFRYIVTFQEMTIKHLMYTQKVPCLHTERACAGFFRF